MTTWRRASRTQTTTCATGPRLHPAARTPRYRLVTIGGVSIVDHPRFGKNIYLGSIVTTARDALLVEVLGRSAAATPANVLGRLSQLTVDACTRHSQTGAGPPPPPPPAEPPAAAAPHEEEDAPVAASVVVAPPPAPVL